MLLAGEQINYFCVVEIYVYYRPTYAEVGKYATICVAAPTAHLKKQLRYVAGVNSQKTSATARGAANKIQRRIHVIIYKEYLYTELGTKYIFFQY